MINRALNQGEKTRIRASLARATRLRHPMVFGTINNIVHFHRAATDSDRRFLSPVFPSL